MTLILISFFAGILTVAAPCVLPLLPVVIGGSLGGVDAPTGKTARSPYVIVLSLAVSVVIFTLLLKTTTALLGVPTSVWQVISGGIIILFGLQLVLPLLWEVVSVKLRLQSVAGRWLNQGGTQKSAWQSDVLLGAALGPVFNSCSPTYALLVATILPVSFSYGLVALTAYAIGLSGTLLAISLLGQRILLPLKAVSNPDGWFRRGLGVLLILTGIAIIFGLDKMIQAYVLEQGWYDAVAGLEEVFLGR